MLAYPSILLTGKEGVGKSTILNLFPDEIILELDDDFNEIYQKQIKITNFSQFKECILREIDLDELTSKFNSYQKLLHNIEIICIVLDSTERNITESQELLTSFFEKVPNIKFYAIANFQDRKSISKSIEEIENSLKLKTFGFSAIQDDSLEKFNDIIKEILETSLKAVVKRKTNKSKKYIEKIIDEIEGAILSESNREHLKAAEIFSNVASKLEKLDLESEEFKSLFFLCKAWQCMTLGEEKIQKFAEAEILFNQANEHLSDTNLKNLVYANSIFCEILKLSTQFDELEDIEKKDVYYSKIKSLIRSSIEFYDEGDFEKEAEWAKNTLKMLETK